MVRYGRINEDQGSLSLEQIISVLDWGQDYELRALFDLLSQPFKGLKASTSETERLEPLNHSN